MKTIQRFTILLLLCFCSTRVFPQAEVTDNCLEPSYHEKCFQAIKSVFDDYLYLKSRPFSREMDNEKFVVNLKKNTLYLFDICQGPRSYAVVNIYDENDQLIASTLDPETSRFTRTLSFYSGASGQYSISVSFKHSDEDCIVVLFGMIRKNIETYTRLPEE